MTVEGSQLLVGALGWLSGVLGAMVVVRIEIRWHRRDIDDLRDRVRALEKVRHG